MHCAAKDVTAPGGGGGALFRMGICKLWGRGEDWRAEDVSYAEKRVLGRYILKCLNSKREERSVAEQ